MDDQLDVHREHRHGSFFLIDSNKRLTDAPQTGSAIANFVLAMVLHPEVLAKAQAEVDSVVGRSRLPDFCDRPSLPYVEAMVSECLRYSTPAPLSTSVRLNIVR